MLFAVVMTSLSVAGYGSEAIWWARARAARQANFVTRVATSAKAQERAGGKRVEDLADLAPPACLQGAGCLFQSAGDAHASPARIRTTDAGREVCVETACAALGP